MRSVKRRDPIALCSAIGSTNCRCTDADAEAVRIERVRRSRVVNTRYGSVRAPSACADAARRDSSGATLAADG